jgi:transcription elongation factor
MRDDDIADIVDQLKRLQIRQDLLIARLGELSANNNSIPAMARASRIPPDTETVTARSFAIGDRVRIRNPNRQQANKGVVTNITANSITVQDRLGNKIIRAPHNVYIDDE